MRQSHVINPKPVYFLMMYFFTACAGTTYYTFIPIYLQSEGFSDIQMGILLAIGPFVALLAQPFWGTAGDRAKSKNTVFRAVMLGTAVCALLYPISSNFLYLFILISIFTFFNNSMFPIQDAIVLEAIEGTGWEYGRIRMASTIGYAVMALGAGIAAKFDIRLIFIMCALFAMASFFSTYKIPTVIGHQSVTGKVSPKLLLKNWKLLLLTGFAFVNFIPQGYYNNFFVIYYREIGADNFLTGLAVLIAVIVEIPFLLFADKIIKKIGINASLIIAAFIMGTRFVLVALTKDIYLMLLVSILHGGTFIVFTYCMAVFINKEVQPELKASGQTLYSLIVTSVARIIASVAGGYANSAFDMDQVIMCSAIINYASIVIFVAILFVMAARRRKFSLHKT